jgi:RNA polymerase sigma-70 factor (ECF subfamily)
MAARPTGDDLPEDERLDDEAAAELEALFKEHARTAYKYLRSRRVDHQSAEDLVDDVFLKIGPRLRDGVMVESPRRYVLTAVHNAWVDWLRSPVRRQWADASSRLEAEDWSSADEFDRVCDHEDRQDTLRLLRRAIELLQPRQGQIVKLRYIAGMSDAEIALKLGIAEGTVRYNLSKGRDKLKKLLDEWTEEGSGA